MKLFGEPADAERMHHLSGDRLYRYSVCFDYVCGVIHPAFQFHGTDVMASTLKTTDV